MLNNNMQCKIEYVQDGEMNTEDVFFFLREFILILPSVTESEMDVRHEGKKSYIIIHSVDIIQFTKEWIKNFHWTESFSVVDFKEFMEMLELVESDYKKTQLCIGLFNIFSAFGAETYEWNHVCK